MTADSVHSVDSQVTVDPLMAVADQETIIRRTTNPNSAQWVGRAALALGASLLTTAAMAPRIAVDLIRQRQQ